MRKITFILVSLIAFTASAQEAKMDFWIWCECN